MMNANNLIIDTKKYGNQEAQCALSKLKGPGIIKLNEPEHSTHVVDEMNRPPPAKKKKTREESNGEKIVFAAEPE